MKNLIFAVIITIILSAPVLAQTQTPVINEKQKTQQERIKQGIKSGELTKKETKKLEAEQKAIQKDKKLAKADGKVTPVEKKTIIKDQNKASKDIYKLKHNKRNANRTKKPLVNNNTQQ
jgi:hypothetical protein